MLSTLQRLQNGCTRRLQGQWSCLIGSVRWIVLLAFRSPTSSKLCHPRRTTETLAPWGPVADPVVRRGLVRLGQLQSCKHETL
mgnify:CR=1 FL=1